MNSLLCIRGWKNSIVVLENIHSDIHIKLLKYLEWTFSFWQTAIFWRFASWTASKYKWWFLFFFSLQISFASLGFLQDTLLQKAASLDWLCQNTILYEITWLGLSLLDWSRFGPMTNIAYGLYPYKIMGISINLELADARTR